MASFSKVQERIRVIGGSARGVVTRILYTAFDLVPSPKGASTHITYNVRGLVGAGYTVHLLTPGDGVLAAEDTYEGATITRVPPVGSTNFLSRALAFGQAVMEHVASAPPYDVVHFRSVWDGVLLAAAREQYGYKTLFEVNGLPNIELKYHYPALATEFRNAPLLEKLHAQVVATLANSETLICPSEVTRAYLVSLGVPRSRITVIANGVNPREFAPTPLPPADGHTPTLLYLGTLTDWQGLETLIAALPLICAVQPVQVRIVGRGRSHQRKAIARQIRKLGLEDRVRVEAAVPHHEVPALIAAADVCVAPLALNDRNVTQGCCPIKVLEYMACARPLVVANLPVARELVREEVDALLFTPNDPHDLARQVLRLLSDRALAERLAASAAARVQAQFTWHRAQKRLIQVYEREFVAARGNA